jgi:hypothetical protein
MTNLQNMELARSIERHRNDCIEHDSSNRKMLQRVSTMLNAWAARRDRS